MRKLLAPDTEPTKEVQGFGFVDLHAHVLPGVDDGPEDWDQAVEMLKRAAQGGTSIVVATPHGDARRRWDKVNTLRSLCDELNKALEQEQVALSLVLGMETGMELDLVEQVEKGESLTINNSRYILVEPPFSQLPLFWEEALFRLQLGGLQPILAHPERQNQVQAKPDLIAGVVDRGVMVQVTAGSVAGKFGPKAKKTAEYLLKNQLVDVLASDCHTVGGSRSPDMAEGFQAAVKLVGRESAERMVSVLPLKIVSG